MLLRSSCNLGHTRRGGCARPGCVQPQPTKLGGEFWQITIHEIKASLSNACCFTHRGNHLHTPTLNPQVGCRAPADQGIVCQWLATHEHVTSTVGFFFSVRGSLRSVPSGAFQAQSGDPPPLVCLKLVQEVCNSSRGHEYAFL